MLKEFFIDEKYLDEETVITEYSHIKDKENLTNEDLIKLIKGTHKSTVISKKEHDEFTKLRNQLEDLGYIETERNWWNGDRILKSFKLNGWIMRKEHKFPCAVALKTSIVCARKYNWKTISSY